MAITRLGVGGPMTAYLAFSPKQLVSYTYHLAGLGDGVIALGLAAGRSAMTAAAGRSTSTASAGLDRAAVGVAGLDDVR